MKSDRTIVIRYLGGKEYEIQTGGDEGAIAHGLYDAAGRGGLSHAPTPVDRGMVATIVELVVAEDWAEILKTARADPGETEAHLWWDAPQGKYILRHD